MNDVNQLTPEAIAELKRKYDAATKGEWIAFVSVAGKTVAIKCDEPTDIVIWPGFDNCDRSVAGHAHNARFIAVAHNNFSALLSAATQRTEAERKLAEVSEILRMTLAIEPISIEKRSLTKAKVSRLRELLTDNEP